MHIIQEQETCSPCTYDALDRHADTHTMAVSAEENTQRQHLWRMAGERTQNMRNENKNAKERKKHKKKNNVNDHFFLPFHHANARHLWPRRDEMWYILFHLTTEIPKASEKQKQKNEEGEKRQQHLEWHIWCAHVSGVSFIAQRRTQS